MALSRTERLKRARATLASQVASERALRQALERDLQRVVTQAAAAYPAWQSVIKPHQSQVRATLSTGLQRVATASLEHVTGLLNADIPLPTMEELRNRAAAQARSQAGQRAVEISNTTRERLANAIARGVDARDPPAAIARRIRDEVGGMSRARATTIARTETATASSVVQQQSAEQLNDALGLGLMKTWTATSDDRTRESHAAADGQRVAIDGVFTVGGAELRHPSDPDGPPEEVINCRCVVVYEHTAQPDKPVDAPTPPTPDKPVEPPAPAPDQFVEQTPTNADLDHLADSAPLTDTWEADPTPQGAIERYNRNSDADASVLRRQPGTFDAVKRFSDIAYDDIRKSDRGVDMGKTNAKYAELINKAIESESSSYETLYRGISVTKSDAEAIFGAGEIKFDAMSSTTVSRKVAEKYFTMPSMGDNGEDRNVGIVLKLKNERGLSIGGISSHQEYEVVIGKGGTYDIHSVKRINTGGDLKFLVELSERKLAHFGSALRNPWHAIDMKKAQKPKRPSNKKPHKGSVRVRIVNGVPCV